MDVFPNEVALTCSVPRAGVCLLESHHSFSPLQLLTAKRGKSEASLLTEINTTLPKNKTINVNAVKHQLTGHTRNRTLQGWSEQNSDYGKLQNKNSVSSAGKLQVRWVREMEEETYVIFFWGGGCATPCAMWDLSSLIRDQTCSLCTVAWILRHCISKEVPRIYI